MCLLVSDSEQSDDWDGVVDLCQAVDDAMEIDNDTELLADKRVLEVGTVRYGFI